MGGARALRSGPRIPTPCLHVRELEVPTLEMAVERGVAGDRCDDWPIRRGLGARARREETKCEGGYGWASRDSGVSC